jgi:putative DNA primase/helicase
MADTESPIAAANRARIQKLQSFRRTDAGNAEAFELLHGESFRFDHTKEKWLVWNDRYWIEDKDGEADRAALETARERLSAAALIQHDDDRKAGIEWALATESVHRRRTMLISARSVKSLATRTSDYDQDAFLLTVGNGTVDLRTGILREARREDLITRATDVIYDPSATAPRWGQFLNEVFGGESEIIGYVQRAVGYSLTGNTREQCFFLLCGSGANGKTTFLETIVKLLGTHASTAAFSAFLVQHNQGGPRNDLAALCGARFVKAAEAEHKASLDESIMKQLTGEDTISARFLFHEGFEYRPQFKIWLATNRKPAIWETSDAIWRRIKLIEFNQQFTGRRADLALRGKLEAELPGILAWAVQGCLAWQKFGLGEPQRILRAILGYRQESDQIGRFVRERCDLQPDRRTYGKELYDDYVLWCGRVHEIPVANNLFVNKLAERGIDGIERKRAAGGVVYRGLGLLPITTPDASASPARKEKGK